MSFDFEGKVDVGDVMNFRYLRTASEYTDEVETAGLIVVAFQDTSQYWTSIKMARVDDDKDETCC